MIRARVIAGIAAALASFGAGDAVAHQRLRPNTTPVVAFGFDQNFRGLVLDSSGSLRRGVLERARLYRFGKYGAALAVSGRGSLAWLASTSALDLSHGMTLEAWLRPDARRRNAGTVFKRGSSLKRPRSPYGLTLIRGIPAAYVTTRPRRFWVVARSRLPIRRWSYLAATYDGSVLRLYVDGRPVASARARGRIIVSTGPLEIGNGRQRRDTFMGLIDNVRIFSAARSEKQIRADGRRRVQRPVLPKPRVLPKPPAPVAAAPTYAGPTFLANSFTLAGNGVDSVPHSVMEMAVSPDGYAMMGSSWEEYQHDARLFDPNTGALLGPYTPVRAIYGVAVDTNYVYYASGDGRIFRGPRSRWTQPGQVSWFDSGVDDYVGPLTVDSGRQLMGLAECDNELFVSDPGGSLLSNGQVSPNTTTIKVIPTNLTAIRPFANVPRARSIACDKEGDIWVLQQAVSNGPAADVERFTPTGALVGRFNLPGYPTGLAADPTQDRLLVPDNGPDQDFKWFNYAGHQIGQIGVTGGYRAGPDPGIIGPNRFVGPRAAAIDASGDVYAAESAEPGIGDEAWVDMGPAAIFTKFGPDGSVKWRDYGLDFSGTGQPTSDGSRFFDLRFEYVRNASGQYQPYAFTVDPFSIPSDARMATVYGGAVYERDLDGHRYLFDDDNPASIYEQQPHSEIFKPVVVLTSNIGITTDGFSQPVTTNRSLIGNNGVEDFWMTDSGDIWSVGGFQIWRYRLQGFMPDGTPLYNFQNVDVYRFPPQLSMGARRIEVDGNNVYLSGFSPTDPNPSHDWDGWKSSGRHLLKFAALPTASGWPAPAWEHDFTYGVGNSASSGPYATGYPTGFAADGPYVAVAWIHDPATGQGKIFTLDDSDGAPAAVYSPPVPSYGAVGWLDGTRSISAKNGWVWAGDDWQSKIYGICPSQRCT